jgi:16S rRNA U1498 N3-methylase RsmE
MFVNFSPADYNVDETVTSLSYAARVKKIVNSAAKQAESEEVAKLKSIIKRLQAGGTVPVEIDAEEEANNNQPDIPLDDGKVYDGY